LILDILFLLIGNQIQKGVPISMIRHDNISTAILFHNFSKFD